MEGDAKKWLIDFTPSESDTESCIEDDFRLDIDAFPKGLFDRQLFINAASWMPMSALEVYNELWTAKEKNGHGYKRFLARASIIAAVTLEASLLDSTTLDPVLFSSYTEKIITVVSKCLKEAGTCPLETMKEEILKLVLEILESLLGAIFRAQSGLSPGLCVELIGRLSLVSILIGEVSIGTLLKWKTQFENSSASDFLRHHPEASVSIASLTMELNIIKMINESGTNAVEMVKSFVVRIFDRISAPEQVERVLPILRLLYQTFPLEFVKDEPSVHLVLYLSLHTELDDLETLLKCVNTSSFFTACIWSLRSSSQALSESASSALHFWASQHSDYTSMQALLDEISRGTKQALRPQDAVSVSLKSLISLMSIENQFTYLLHWLRKFEGICSLSPLLTHVEKSDQVKPLVDLLEIGFSVLHFVTPARSAMEKTASSKITEVGTSIPASVYHELATLVLERMDVPSYFYHLNDTREFDAKGYKLAEIRVRAFQHLVGHYWYILESMFSHMPPMSELTKDNPILLLPEGVTPKTEFPPWFDALLVTMAINGMVSDFSTNDTIQDANHCMNTLLNCASVKEATGNQNLFSLRLRSCVALIKSTKQETVDEANKFSLIMWLCARIPMRELNMSDAFDSLVFNAVMGYIADTLNDYHPKIKMLGLRLVQELAGTSSSKGSSSAPVKFPQAIFDAIVKSLNFREEELVEMALKVCIALTKSAGEERLLIARGSALMSAISYEMDYVQKQELLLIYLEQLKGFLPLLELNLLNFSHPLTVRLLALLDVGTFKMTSLALDNLLLVIRITWPRIHLDAEMIFGALAAVWIDQVLVLPGETLSETVQNNVEEIKRKIHNCIVILIAASDIEKTEKIYEQLSAVQGLESFTAHVSPLLKSRIDSEKQDQS